MFHCTIFQKDLVVPTFPRPTRPLAELLTFIPQQPLSKTSSPQHRSEFASHRFEILHIPPIFTTIHETASTARHLSAELLFETHAAVTYAGHYPHIPLIGFGLLHCYSNSRFSPFCNRFKLY